MYAVSALDSSQGDGLNEQDPNGLSPSDPGAKMDSGKDQLFKGLIKYFPRALRAVSRLSATGAAKYDWNGYSAVENGEERYQEAMVRHVFDLAEGVEYDLVFEDEANGVLYYHHQLVSDAWNALAALEMATRERELVTEFTHVHPQNDIAGLGSCSEIPVTEEEELEWQLREHAATFLRRQGS